MTALLEVKGLEKSFSGPPRLLRRREQTKVVRGVDLEVQAGQSLAIIGESGAGKSTVARLINRLIEPDAGSVRMLGTEVTSLSAKQLRSFRAHMQMIFQDPYSSLDPRRTIEESVSEPLLLHTSMTAAERKRRAGDLLEQVGLGAAYLSRRPRVLSGGQLQRVSIARALSVEPELLICDEPVSALDVSIQAQVLNLLLGLKEQLGLSFIMILHDLALVPIVADHVVVMRSGEVIESGEAQRVIDAPEHPYTKDLVASMPRLVPKSRRHHEFEQTL